MTCCFISPRRESLLWRSNENDERCVQFKILLQQQIERLINEFAVSHFIVGLDRGIDFYAAEIILNLKESYPISLECAIPFEDQASKWPLCDCNRYFSILDKSDNINVLQLERTNSCILNYKKYIVKSSEFVISILNGRPNGKGLDNAYSPWFGKQVVTINPDSLSVCDKFNVADDILHFRFFMQSGKIEEWTVTEKYSSVLWSSIIVTPQSNLV